MRPDRDFMASMASLESGYLKTDEPEMQSGFSGGRARWIRERSPLAEAIEWHGDFLDVGCANGLLAADVVDWAAGRGYEITPYGIDIGPRLVSLARDRHSNMPAHFAVADAWTWEPKRKWDYVYSLVDLAPEELRCEFLSRLASWVAPGGRLILGSYGSRSRLEDPQDLAGILANCGFEVAGAASGGIGPISRFAWTTRLT